MRRPWTMVILGLVALALAVFLYLITDKIKRPIWQRPDSLEWHLAVVRQDDKSLGVEVIGQNEELSGLVALVHHNLSWELPPDSNLSGEGMTHIRQRYTSMSSITYLDFDSLAAIRLTEDEKLSMWSLIQSFLAEEYLGIAKEVEILQDGKYEYVYWKPGLYYNLRLIGCNVGALVMLIWAFTNIFGLVKVLRRKALGHCSKCGYNLRGDFEHGCAECGWGR